MKVDPQNAVTRGFLADTLVENGQYRRAIEEYETALWLDPADSTILGNFARLLTACKDEELRDYDRAVRLAGRAYHESPQHVRSLTMVYTSIAIGLSENGDYDRAIENYRTALQVHPNNKLSTVRGTIVVVRSANKRTVYRANNNYRTVIPRTMLTDSGDGWKTTAIDDRLTGHAKGATDRYVTMALAVCRKVSATHPTLLQTSPPA